MGRSPGARSTPAPEGTSAVPGLIPDLISGLPCELWDPLGGVWGWRAQWGQLLPTEASQLHLYAHRQGPAGHSLLSLWLLVSSRFPASFVSFVAAAAGVTMVTGRSPGTERPWA